MKRRGFTLLQAVLLIGSVVILAAIFLPVLVQRREPDRRHGRCQNNLKQIALGFKQYIQDYDEKYPPARNSKNGSGKSDNWIDPLMQYLKSEQVFQCALDKNASEPGRTSYAYNARLSSISEEKLNNSVVIVLNFEVVADPNNWTQTGTIPQNVSAPTRHLDGSNFSFVDGHVKWYKPGKVGMLSPSKGEPTFLPG